jgi:hypothetical protein
MARPKPYTIKPGINYVPRRRKFLFKPAPTANYTPIVAEGPAPVPVAPPLGELVVFSSPQAYCGIAEYSRDLDAELVKLGVRVRQHTLAETNVLRDVQPGTVLLLHVEPSLLSPDFDNALATALQRGAYVGVCFHYLDEILLRRFASRAHAMVVHRNYGISNPLFHEVPLGCPVYEPPPYAERLAIRERLGIPSGVTVVTTLGFLSPWKRLPEVAVELLAQNAGIFVQMICPSHFSGESMGEVSRMRDIASVYQGTLRWSPEFIPASEVLDRVAASDLGFVYHPVNTGSCSAATKPFVSARCPVVLTPSNHSSDVREGAYRVPGYDLGEFTRAVVAVARDAHMMHQLRDGMQRDYERLNMTRVAQMYVDVYRKIGVGLV